MRKVPLRRKLTTEAAQDRVALLALVLLCAWVIWRCGGTHLFSTIPLDGVNVVIPDTFARVDHPFHAVRASVLLESLRHGHLLRWVANHQGGYPVEFYPLGVAWLDVGLWAVLLGAIPIIAVHKLTVLLIFVLPALAYWLMARGDRLSPWVALLATAIHIAIPGDWTNGGYRELIDWGLVTNVGGATFALIACAALARSVYDGQRSMMAGASLAIAAAFYTNPRSVVAIAVTAIAISFVVLFFPDHDNPATPLPATRRLLGIGVAGTLLSAPLLLPLIRYRHLYYFVHYEGYDTLAAFWHSTVTAVSTPVIMMCVVGMIFAFSDRRYVIARSFVIALVGYILLTAALSNAGLTGNIIEQLETPRLMPFQRLVMIYLAAFSIARLVELALRFFRVGWRWVSASVVLGATGVLVLLVMWGSVWSVPDIFATPPVDTTGTLQFEQYRRAVFEANAILPAGTAIFVVGNELDSRSWWHEQLWGPAESEAPFFYDDWLWYWHRDHKGPYNAENGHFYPDPAEALTATYFQTHGIGVVLVTTMPTASGNDPRVAARQLAALHFDRTVGNWDIYRVAQPTPIVANGPVQPASLVLGNESITATFTSAHGNIQIRRNWFPRWSATADGKSVPIERTDNGYMRVVVPDGTQVIELKYDVTAMDWAARLAALCGVGGLFGMVLGPDKLFARKNGSPTTTAIQEFGS